MIGSLAILCPLIGQCNFFPFGFATLTSSPLCFLAQTMKTELLTKQNDFLPVAQHGALLFSVMCELQKLHPYYRFPLEAFMQLFHDTVAERNRGKKSSGSPAVRAAELVTALSRKIFERTSWSLFQSKLIAIASFQGCHRLGKKNLQCHEILLWVRDN